MYGRMSYRDAIAKAVHFVAVDQTTIYLDDDDPDLPWDAVTRVESGGGIRLNGPAGVYLCAPRAGLTFKWSVDFEGRDANGKSVSLFDRPRLRELMRKLPSPARAAFAQFLAKEVLPVVEKRTTEYRGYLNQQLDSEDCVRGLIAFAAGEGA